MREKTVEQHLTHAVTQAGGHAYKLVCPGTAGMPDRLVLLPGGHTAFVELKAPGRTPRPLQTHRHNQLRALGAQVHVIDHPNQIPEVLNAIRAS